MQVDLNLLVALDALLEECSVQGAADRLHLSPPAMSRTLSRIRRATGDEVLVRSGRTMVPTPRALGLQGETREVVRAATALLTPRRGLDLASLRRTFTVRSHDALLGPLAAALTDDAAAAGPGVALRFLAEPDGDSAELARGRVDLEVGSGAAPSAEVVSATVGADTMVLVCRPEHPLARGEVDAGRFAGADHVSVSRRGRAGGVVDDALASHGLVRRVVAVLPTSASALELVSRTSAVAVVAGRSCAPTVASLGLVTLAVPVDLPPVPVVLAWHRRQDGDPAHRWLRSRARTVLEDLLAAPAPAG